MSQHTTHGTPPLELIEQAVHGLRRLPLTAHLAFLTGTVPFLLGFLWFWSDMSRGARADRRCAQEALVVALLYLWMKTWHAVYGAALGDQMTATPPRTWTLRRWCRCLLVQSAIQPWGLILVPLSLLPLMLPFPWVFAYFKHGDAVADEAAGRVTVAGRQAGRETRRWPGQNHGLIGLFMLITLVVSINVTVVLSQLPALIHMLTGLESDFTLSPAALVLNSTFLLTVVAVTYLVVMPLLIAVYARRGFEGAALLNGADLRAELTRLKRLPAVVGLGLMLWVGGWLGQPIGVAWAAGVPPGTPELAQPPIPQLDQAIEQVLNRPDFSWRTHRELGGADDSMAAAGSPWERFIRGLLRRVDAVGKMLKSPVDGLGKIIRDLVAWFRGNSPVTAPPPTGTDEVDWMTGIKLVLYTVLAAAVLALGWYGQRLWRRRQPRVTLPVTSVETATPDLTAEHVSAAALPETGWLQLARELAGRGEFRLAIRAVYLAELAHLAGRQLVRLADAKSNREYQYELERRARALPAVRTAFAATVQAFDRVWYGHHEANADAWGYVERNFEALRSENRATEGGAT